jgi:hypothetical protein
VLTFTNLLNFLVVLHSGLTNVGRSRAFRGLVQHTVNATLVTVLVAILTVVDALIGIDAHLGAHGRSTGYLG